MASIRDGMIFETFAQQLLCQIIGPDFTPIGGHHDGGADGLVACYTDGKSNPTVYQISIEKDVEGKINKTLDALAKSRPNVDRLNFVTNQEVANLDRFTDLFYEERSAFVQIRDSKWLLGQINRTEALQRLYLTFVESHCHEYTRGPRSMVVTDFVSDPRLYVFLRQRLDEQSDGDLEAALADATIMYALEGTDPDKGRLRTRGEILDRIDRVLAFPVKKLEVVVDRRLQALSRKKGRRINHHTKDKSYCLPYATRLALEEQNLEDAALHAKFMEATEKRLERRLRDAGVRVRDLLPLITSALCQVFKQQGLAFSTFFDDPSKQDHSTVECHLLDIVRHAVEGSSVTPKNHSRVSAALLGAIRETIYSGSDEELEYLRRLGASYMCAFLLQADPQVARYFATMAGRLKVFVGTSILVPALSERLLGPPHRRHWNLLKSAYEAGVSLLIDRGTLRELASHIRGSIVEYELLYRGVEHLFADEMVIVYIDKILIRAYFYQRHSGYSGTFSDFLNHLVTPDGVDMEAELATWLRGEFGVEVFSPAKEDVAIDADDHNALVDALAERKRSRHQAQNDATTILSVYGIRERNDELGSAGAFGYETWWLSKDSVTQPTIVEVLGDRYRSGCYMRPEFLNAFVALAPRPERTDRSFDLLFPTLVGVGMSHHVPSDITKRMKKVLEKRDGHTPARLQAMMRTLSDQLKGGHRPEDEIVHYLDDLRQKMVRERRASVPPRGRSS